MSSNPSFTVLAGVAALTLAGTAMANTSLDGTSTGDIFLNIVDTTNSTSFLFDTGISQSSFNGSASLSAINFGDANWTAFKTAAGTDALNYSLVSATRPSGVTIFFTSQITGLGAISSGNLAQAQTLVSGFTSSSNSVTSSTTNSANLGSANWWGDPSREGAFATNLTASASGDNAAVGTAMAFYSETAANLKSGNATIATFAGMWNVSGTSLTYTVGSGSVPLPAPLVLLLSGLGLTGLMGRRKSTGSEPGVAAA